jgi:hypothetical protein
LRISVFPLSMYLCVEEFGFTSFYVFVYWRYRFYLFLCICLLRISVLPLSMYLCVEDIRFTSFYVFVCWGYRFFLFLCICVLRISILPLSMNFSILRCVTVATVWYLFVFHIIIGSYYAAVLSVHCSYTYITRGL